MKRLLIFLHRWLGIPMSIVFVVWFISGVVMIYTGGMPSISREEQLARAQTIEPALVRLTAEAAWSRTGMPGSPRGVQLRMLVGRPLWRFESGFGRALHVFADTGEALDGVSADMAAISASAFLDLPVERIRFVDTLTETNQWTLAQPRDLPLHLLHADDPSATHVYVSVASGEVALVTTRSSRFLAWIGVIPHWLYFTPLRTNQPVWYWTVVGLSLLGCVLAALGIALAFTQFRRSRPFSLSKSIRYRGWMRWHYISGALFGVFALTWVFSGLMSMEPFAWMSRSGLELPRDVLAGGSLDPGEFPQIGDTVDLDTLLGERQVVELSLRRVLAEPYFVLQQVGERTLVHAETLRTLEPFEPPMLVRAVEDALDGVGIAAAELLDEFDAYYYARSTAVAPLPVLRLKFDDPMATWYYIDPAEARILTANHRYSRIERWLFSGLHSLDFSFWYDKRPLWDIGMIALSAGALLTSLTGMFLGLRRLLRFGVG